MGNFLTAEWNNLIMANYAVDAAILQPHLPAGTELDFYNGKAYVSLVGFMFENTKMLGIKIPFHVNFEEVNLRFYVKYNERGKRKRGVVFIREIVPRFAITFVANTLYHEKYSTMRMKHFFINNDNEFNIGYHWKYKNKWHKLEAVTETKGVAMQPGSAEEFITEHYWGYSRYNAHTTYEYPVQHPAWKVYPVKNYLVDIDFAMLYGEAFGILQNTKPDSVFVAQGSAIAVLGKKKL